MAKKKTAQTPAVLELDYQLAELPSSQHRAGLAGVVLMVRWLERLGTNKGICQLTRLDQYGATLKINKQGLEALFCEIFGAFKHEPGEKKREQQSESPNTNSSSASEDEDGEEAKDNKFRVVPKGAFLLNLDPSAHGNDGIWIKLWRDMLFSTLRGRDRQRIPFKQSAEGKIPKEAGETWEALSLRPDRSVKMPSTYFAGAQDNNPEDVPFKDWARYQLLLRFWPYAAQTYVPAIIENDGKEKYWGYALAIPDVANLEWFCDELPVILKNSRSTELSGYRPRDSVVDLAIEGALDVLRRLRERLSVLEGGKSTSDLVLGVDVIHFVKEKRNINIKGIFRVDPEAAMIDEYTQFRGSLRNRLFRRQRVLNLVNQREWHAGFDSLLCTMPYEQTIGNKTFRRDTRESFSNEVKTMNEQHNDATLEVPANGETASTDSAPEISEEALVYKVVGVYLSRKLKSKYQLEWTAVKNNPAKRAEYGEMREKLAREVFLAVRSRTGQDFIDYFASTICSVSQTMKEPRFVALTRALLEDTDKVRTLTMLALSARS